MSKPLIAVVGRPNVGKSTLFNKIVGKRLSIVEDTPGVTRDRIYAEGEWRNKTFHIVDTGGIEPKTDDVILSQMRRQAQMAIDSADVILFVVDIRTGMTATDQDVASMLQRSGKPVVLCVNKCDSVGTPPPEFYEFYNLGIGDPYPVSSVHGHGVGDLLDACYAHLDFDKEDEYGDENIKVAVIGKPNVGKSSLINRMAGEERVIVSNIAGTTRDATDTFVENEYGQFVFIDTAGIRRKAKVEEAIEKYSVLRSYMAVDRSDVCVIVIDATEGFTEQDSKVAGYAHEQGKGCIIAVNKWDAVEKDDKTIYKFTKEIREKLSYMPYAELLFVSAATGQRLPKLFETIDAVIENHSLRVATGVLNEIMTEAVAMQQPPTDKGKRLKLFYITQVAVKPPTFVIFVNDKELMHFSYTRYIENKIREAFGFRGTPLKFIIRERKEK